MGPNLKLVAGAAAIAAAAALCAPAPAAAVGPRYMTVMTFNVARGQVAGGDLRRIAAVIRSARPNVVGLQEVDRSWSRSGSVDQAAELARLLGMRHRFTATLDCARRDADADGFCQYGTAILSRHPILPASGRRYRLPAPAAEEPRALARVTVDVAGRPVDVFNTHLSFVEATRVRQVEAVKRLVRHDRRPFVLTGDFNALPFHLEMVSLRRVVRDGPIAAGRPHLRTTALARPVRLDYVFLPRSPFNGPPERVAALSAFVIRRPRVSDHRPLVVRIRIPGAATGAR
jgi:endonuclease/exonuclease/phosphatase family metal-dependent hydrolase